MPAHEAHHSAPRPSCDPVGAVAVQNGNGSPAAAAIRITLPDGSRRALHDGATGADLAADIGPGLARQALAVKLTGAGLPPGGEVRDLARPLPDGVDVEIITAKSKDALALIRHDAAHVLAAATMDLYPGVKISIGPAIDSGFYYDFEFPPEMTLTAADLPALEKAMAAHVAANEEFARADVSVAEARARFVAEEQDYKVELIDDLVAAAEQNGGQLETVSLYTNGPFTDLCRGPHARSTATVKAFKLLSIAGAYWRGDSARPMLTRVYGTAFLSKSELDEHLERLEQARARDHRRLGPQLGLFSFSNVSQGAAFWHPAGTQVFNSLITLSREMGLERGYTEVKTPLIYDSELWVTSGHWGKYRENMFLTGTEDREMAVKPMNCPGHAHLFALSPHSYRDLPVRFSEPGLLHRNEPSGTLHGLLRVRHFTQDDAHVFCTEEQVESEVAACLEFAFATYALFGFEVELELSTRPENRIGTDEMWDRAEGKLMSALKSHGLAYRLNPGDGAFYGPKIDLHMTDSLGRAWQIGTVQLDYSMPERFGLTYTGADNAEHRPVMIHRALMGSYERFIGILIEHLAGELPLWLAPVQVAVLPISDRHVDAAEQAGGVLRAAGVRVEVDARTESMGRKIREAEMRKIPYMAVIGDREAADRTVSVRRHGAGGADVNAIAEFAERLAAETAASRSLA